MCFHPCFLAWLSSFVFGLFMFPCFKGTDADFTNADVDVDLPMDHLLPSCPPTLLHGHARPNMPTINRALALTRGEVKEKQVQGSIPAPSTRKYKKKAWVHNVLSARACRSWVPNRQTRPIFHKFTKTSTLPCTLPSCKRIG